MRQLVRVVRLVDCRRTGMSRRQSHEVGFITSIYRDPRSTEHKKLYAYLNLGPV
jgi:hypothetical protein